jgi:hypothetical protein
VPCSDRNRAIADRRILIATGGSTTAELGMKYSSLNDWLSKAWMAFMDESQQYGGYHEVASLVAIKQPILAVCVGDHRQTPGGLSKGRAASENCKKLLKRPLRLRALNQEGDYVPPIRLASIVGRLWPDACCQEGSDLSQLVSSGTQGHAGPWLDGRSDEPTP